LLFYKKSVAQSVATNYFYSLLQKKLPRREVHRVWPSQSPVANGQLFVLFVHWTAYNRRGIELNKFAFCTAFAAFSAFATISPFAHADGIAALEALKTNLARAKVGMPFNINNVEASSTVVKGIYVLQDKGTSTFRLFTNEAGSIIGTAAGWQRVSQPNQLSSEEKSEIRSELIKNIDTDKLIKIKFGDGAGRRMVLLSAIDCPGCFAFEQNLDKLAPILNTTFYVLPSSLQDESSQKGRQNWQTVANIWCAQDNASAWLSYWKKPAPIAGQHCGLNSHDASVLSGYFFLGLLPSVGIKPIGTPAILREDGNLYVPKLAFDKKYALENFSEAALGMISLQPTGKPNRWFQ
jgi:hypothetical protein